MGLSLAGVGKQPRRRFERDLTQEQIGAHIGISQMQVSSVLRQSLVRMRQGAGAEAA